MMIKPIRWPPERQNDPILRDGLIFVLFTKAPLENVIPGFQKIFDAWLDIIQKEKLVWYFSSGDENKPVKKSSISRLRGMLNIEKAKKRDITAFQVFSEPEGNPDYLIDLVYSERYSSVEGKSIGDTNNIEMRFPTEFLAGENLRVFIDFVLTSASTFEFDSGYASLGINGFNASTRVGDSYIREHAFHHPGFDLSDNHFTMYMLGRKCRGARWLTFLGKPLIDQLGGLPALQKQLEPRILIKTTGSGIMIQAGEYPEVGDTKNGDNLPLLRAVAKAIKPVTFFQDPYLYDLFDRENKDPELAHRWERRFLD